MNNDIRDTEIVQALLDHPVLGFIDKGEYLRKGECPNCQKRELFIRKSQPYQVKCSREGKCGYAESSRELVPELFEKYSERYPVTHTNPNATADAYLSHNRGFDLHRMRGWYEQQAYKIPETNDFCSTIRFYLNAERTRYWERLIDKTKKDGQKANFAGKRKADGTLYKGDYWAPKELDLKKGDTCYVVEGIFHAIALFLSGRNAAAALTSVNYPETLFEKYKNLNINWVFGLDNEPSGLSNMKKFVKRLKEMKQKVSVCLVPDDKDWDDHYRSGRLTAEVGEKFIENGLYRGKLFLSETAKEMAYHMYCRNKWRRYTLEFRNAIYSIKVGSDVFSALEGKKKDDEEAQSIDIESQEGREAFESNIDVEQISNCVPKFLYQVNDEILNNRCYVFQMDYCNGSPREVVDFEGSKLESPAAFLRCLLNKTSAGTFDGTPKDLKTLRDKWFNNGVKNVTSFPYVGYEKSVNAWIFQDHAYFGGKKIDLNEHKYFNIGKRSVRSSLKSVRITTEGTFDPAWIHDYQAAFSWQGMALLSFFLGSLFVDQIRSAQSSFTFFEYTGEPDAGKSTALEFCWKLFGRDDHEGFDMTDATRAGLRRAFNQMANMPVVLIESDRNGGSDRNKQKAIDFDQFKKLYNGRGTGMLGVQSNDNETREQLFLGALCFSQNAEVDGSKALISRIVHAHADKKHHFKGSLEIARKLEAMPVEELCGFLDVALANESLILKTYFEKFTQCEKRFRENGKLKTNRIIKCHAQIAALGHTLPILFPTLTAQHCDMLESYLFTRAHDREDRFNGDHPMIQEFWEMYEYLSTKFQPNAYSRENTRELSGETIQSEFLNHSKNPETEIAISLPHFNEMLIQSKQRPMEREDLRELKKLLHNCQRYPLIESNKATASRILHKTVKCWVFSKKQKQNS